ncbi:nicotinamide-nucleotide adenylyltransferase [Enterobacter cloacae]|uniref:Nicotinamide-nucleotide adenylyltransferase n=1 Tax=Enterobacter cloacae TaxID=550 RepID=A0A377M9N4_ENTCL|nr:nicotinamide-nucleotide adenylyltransferase [Enterobacter cloacae]
MSSFDYIKTAIRQKGCTLQQVADASGMTKGYLSQLLNAKNQKAPARKSWKRYIAFWGLNSRVCKRTSAWCLVSFTRCIPAIST